MPRRIVSLATATDLGALKPETVMSSRAHQVNLCPHTRQRADGPEPSHSTSVSYHVLSPSVKRGPPSAAEIIAQPIKKVLVIFNEMSW